MKLRIALLSVVAALLTLPVSAADKVKIGFVTTLTTGAAVIGKYAGCCQPRLRILAARWEGSM